MDEETKEELREIVRRSKEGISKSEMFLSLFTEDMVKDPVPVVQLGIAILLDKPITILAPKGTEIPMNIRRVAVAIEEYDPEDKESLFAATQRLMEKMAQ